MLQPSLWGAYCLFIATTPHDRLYNTSLLPKIVPVDKRTVLVDTKNAILYQLTISVIGNFYPNCDANFLRMCGTDCKCRDTIWVKLVPNFRNHRILYIHFKNSNSYTIFMKLNNTNSTVTFLMYVRYIKIYSTHFTMFKCEMHAQNRTIMMKFLYSLMF